MYEEKMKVDLLASIANELRTLNKILLEQGVRMQK